MELEDNGIGDVIEMRGSVEAGPFLIVNAPYQVP